MAPEAVMQLPLCLACRLLPSPPPRPRRGCARLDRRASPGCPVRIQDLPPEMAPPPAQGMLGSRA